MLSNLSMGLGNTTYVVAVHPCSFCFGRRSSESSVDRFDKCLEEFYALCDQMELQLVRLVTFAKHRIVIYSNVPVSDHCVTPLTYIADAGA